MKIELKQSETVVQYACMGLNSITILGKIEMKTSGEGHTKTTTTA
jgi:hypothetical protein